jgi:hypothetical protein
MRVSHDEHLDAPVASEAAEDPVVQSLAAFAEAGAGPSFGPMK